MRRGQVAMEFLVTYGWAILVVLVMIGALSYFGVTNPSRLLPDKCLTTSDFSCTDYVIRGEDAEVRVMLKQGFGQTIYFSGGACEYDGNVVEGSATIGNVDVVAGNRWVPRETLELTCPFPGIGMETFIGEKLRIEFNVSYTLSDVGFAHEAVGTVYAEVQ